MSPDNKVFEENTRTFVDGIETVISLSDGKMRNMTVLDIDDTCQGKVTAYDADEKVVAFIVSVKK